MDAPESKSLPENAYSELPRRLQVNVIVSDCPCRYHLHPELTELFQKRSVDLRSDNAYIFIPFYKICIFKRCRLFSDTKLHIILF